MEGFSYTYPGEKEPALKNINLKLGKGEVVVVAGRSGCGKSTLAKSLCRFLPGGEGTIFFNGRDVTSWRAADMAGEIGYVQQDPEAQIVSLTVREEVAFGLENLSVPRDEMFERISWALEAVRGKHLLDRDTFQLSGGEKQKVAIASVMAMKPKVMILDEPTSGLDPLSTRDVLEALQSFHNTRDMAVVILEHNISHFLPLADRLVVMDGGGIALDIPVDGVDSHRGVLQGLGVRLPNMVAARDFAGGKHSARMLLSVSNLCASRNGRRILEDVSFSVGQGEIVSLMGDNGSGKTTLLLAVMGLLDECCGDISVQGVSSGNFRTSVLAREVGLVFQNPVHQLFMKTAGEEVGFAPENFGMDWSLEKSRLVLRDFNLGEFACKSPFLLSHGQKRRLNIASVHSYGPRILLMDEPFIGQDLDNSMMLVSDITRHVNNGGGVVLVSHDPEMTMQLADRVVFLEEGRIVLEGRPSDVFGKLAERGRKEYVPGGV